MASAGRLRLAHVLERQTGSEEIEDFLGDADAVFLDRQSGRGRQVGVRKALPSSAQRLSASKIKSQAREAEGEEAIAACSTPFGIKDKIAHGLAVQAAQADLCSTPFGIKDKIAGPFNSLQDAKD